MTVIVTVVAALLFAAAVGRLAGWWAERGVTGGREWPQWADVPRHCVQCGRPVPWDNVEDVPGVIGQINVRYLPIPIVCHHAPRVAGWACSPPCLSAWKSRRLDIYHR